MNDFDTEGIEAPGYRLVRPLGRGGVATVFVAMQRSLERQVALKVFDALDEASIARVEQLLRTNARLAHPHIAGIHQIGRNENGRLFHSMPFLLNAALSQHNLRFKPLKVIALLRELLAALEHAHRRGIVHGGIKPSNVLFDSHDSVRLADFGIARCAAELGRPHPSAADYQSPEQARGDAPGQRSDLYSLGVLAWELLTGELPFTGDDAVATAIAHIEQPVPRLPPKLGACQAWFDKALAKSPAQRFQSAGEMANGLSALDGHGVATLAPRMGSRLRVPKQALITTAAVAGLLVALAGWAAWQHRRAVAAADDNVAAPAKAVVAEAAPHAPTPVATPNTTARAARIHTLLVQADALRAQGHLFAPADNNAAERYFAVLVLDPGNTAASAGVDAMLATSRYQLNQAWRARDISRTLAALKHCDLLASHASRAMRNDWANGRTSLAREVGDAMADSVHARDAEQLAALKPLAETLPATYPQGFDLVAAERAAATPTAGETLQDRGGPLLAYVPASGSAPAFAIARVEVTRADYATFAHATHRPAASCREAHNPFSRMRRLSWQSPGFAQGSNHPVVCVDWNDAAAYAAWLSQVTGATYRLPDDSQWLRAAQGMPKQGPCQLGNVDDADRKSAMDNDRWPCSDGAAQTAAVGHYAASGIGAFDLYGNVSEWLAGGSANARAFRGLSWRDGSHQTPLGRRGTADADVGYTSVGFRVVRVIDPAHPAPPAASRR